MEQKTEASQAVDEQVLPHLPRAVGYRHTMDNTEGLKENKPVVVFCATKPNPFGIQGLDYSASFPVTTETLFTADQMRAYARAALEAQPAPTEAPNFCARCGKRLRAGSIHTCTPPAPTEAAQGSTTNNSSSSQLSGNSGELAEGEDSARLDAQVVAAARVLANRSADSCGVNRDDNWNVYSQDFIDDARAALDAARASAETGGVKS